MSHRDHGRKRCRPQHCLDHRQDEAQADLWTTLVRWQRLVLDGFVDLRMPNLPLTDDD